KLRTLSVYGGVGYGMQVRSMQKGVEIVVACPGRLEDLLESNTVMLDDVRFVVVDEADRMADMGFLPAVKRILDCTPADRQTLLFSATLDGDVDTLVKRYQRQPARYDVAAIEQEAGEVEHAFWNVDAAGRVSLTA